MTGQNQVERVERMFAAVGDLYAQYWHDFFHFALFDDEDETWEAAFRRTHDGYVEALRVERATRVLDLACGRGAFTNILAEHTAGDVLGIDASRAQLRHCRRFKRPNLRFKHHDIMRVDELGLAFDAACMLDADCYLPDKGRAVAKVAAVLRPGARFLLLSWGKAEGLNRLQEELVLHPLMRHWAIPGLETAVGYRRHFERSGLRVLEVADLNDRVGRNWEFGYEQALRAIRDVSPKDLPRLLWKGIALGADGVQLVKEQFPAAIYIKAGFDAGFLRYTRFLVEKA